MQPRASPAIIRFLSCATAQHRIARSAWKAASWAPLSKSQRRMIEGIATNLGLHMRVMEDARYLTGDISTSFLREAMGLKA